MPAQAPPHQAFMYHRTAAEEGPGQCAVPSQLRGNRDTLRYFTALEQAAAAPHFVQLMPTASGARGTFSLLFQNVVPKHDPRS
jgi:hypothetical protein